MECGIVSETPKEHFLATQHGMNTQLASVGGMDGVAPDNPTFTTSLIQDKVKAAGVSTSGFTPPTKLGGLTLAPVGEEPKFPLRPVALTPLLYLTILQEVPLPLHLRSTSLRKAMPRSSGRTSYQSSCIAGCLRVFPVVSA